MVKLVPAICPQCGAQLKVNPGDKQMDCEFCGTTIMIDEAVQKYKIEIEHKIRIDGLHGREYQFEQAQKHFDVGEYYDAISFLVSILTDDKFDIEALILFIKCNLTLLKEHNYSPNMSGYNPNYVDGDEECFRDTLELVNRLEKVDQEKSYEKELVDYLPILDKLKEEDIEVSKQKEKNKQYLDALNDDLALAYYYELDEKYFKILSDAFKVDGLLDILKRPEDGKVIYLGELVDLTTDGYLVGSYYLGITDYDKSEHETATLDLKEIANIGDIDNRYNEYRAKADEILNAAIDKDKKDSKKYYTKKKLLMWIGIALVILCVAITGFIVYVFATDPDWPEVWVYIVIGMMLFDVALIPFNIGVSRKWIINGIKTKKDFE